ncbi:hypothetical protein [Stygiolobus azoricus]|uniref:Uncharacterized protein n=1 Tax=Stygiolobus azoricus TaxID=41675 RepID=A0A650CPD2_9CREN|nr:hypothetical protein [Stygiolobus azoricus]QGR19704.1 hypothetical protein D1868_06635 [Stygiolobus azoricus]
MTQDTKANTNLLDIATEIAISAYKPISASGGGKGIQQKPSRGETPPTSEDEDEESKHAVSKTTINNLLALLQTKRDVNLLLLYTMRQSSRKQNERKEIIDKCVKGDDRE